MYNNSNQRVLFGYLLVLNLFYPWLRVSSDFLCDLALILYSELSSPLLNYICF